MSIVYKIHDIAVQGIYDGILEGGILYKLDGEVKMQLREIPCWDNAWRQYEYSLCVISVGELFGYADIESGRIVHKPRWEDAAPFYSGRARVKENGKFGFINKSGEYVITPEWDNAELSAHSGLIAVQRCAKWGFLNEAGMIVSMPEWDAYGHSLESKFATNFDDIYNPCYKNLPIAVCKNELWGFIDDQGNIVIEPQFDTLDFVWSNFQVHWLEDEAAAVAASRTTSVVVSPRYLSAKRKNRWYRVQVGIDGNISILKGKHPKKIKAI